MDNAALLKEEIEWRKKNQVGRYLPKNTAYKINITKYLKKFQMYVILFYVRYLTA